MKESLPLQADPRVLCFHGIGENTPADYAAKAMSRLKKRAPRLASAAIHWGPLLDVPQKLMMRDMKKRGSKGNLIQGVSYKTLGDALAYRNVEGAVRLLADYEITNLGGLDIVVAHSLGCILALGYLEANPVGPPVTLITLGCNLGLWQAGAATNFLKPRRVFRWLNLFDASDGLGGPLGGFVTGVRDKEVELRGPWYSFMVPSADHVGYWSDKDLFERTIPNLLGF